MSEITVKVILFLQPILQQLVCENLAGDSAEILPEAKIDNIRCCPLVIPS